jgi:hypothetical protein
MLVALFLVTRIPPFKIIPPNKKFKFMEFSKYFLDDKVNADSKSFYIACILLINVVFIVALFYSSIEAIIYFSITEGSDGFFVLAFSFVFVYSVIFSHYMSEKFISCLLSSTDDMN